MRDDEQACGLRRIGHRVEGPCLGRTLDGKPGPSEDEQVEIEFARTPSPAPTAAERPLDRLQVRQQIEGTALGIRPSRHVDSHNGIPELGLIGDPDRRRGIQPRDRPEVGGRQIGDGPDRLGERRIRIAEVRSKADIGANASIGHGFVVGEHRLRAMRRVTVRIMHPEPGPGAGPLTSWLAEGRAANARHLHDRFVASGAADVTVVSGPPDAVSFGARVRGLVEPGHPDGIVILGSGAMPLGTGRDIRDFVAAAGVR